MNKIIVAIAVTIFSAFLGLFILPRKVETTRWVKVDTEESVVWTEISDAKKWNQWQPWASDVNSTSIPWDGGEVSNIQVIDDPARAVKEVTFDVAPVGKGRLYLEKVPEGLWIRCEYIYEAPYSPIQRLEGWMHRSEVALKIDSGLEKLEQLLKEKP